MDNQKLLLLNASNMESFPVFPYAFIQVPAVARRTGLKVICTDLLGIPQNKWEKTLQTLVDEHDPAMILITLRNTDSLNARDYEGNSADENPIKPYFPIEQTRALINTIRVISDIKIALGGFGFTVLPNDLMHHLQPDYGVFGDPDGFFEHFRDIQAGNLKDVPNLMYFQDTQLILNERVLYPPDVNAEYTPQVIDQMMSFYEKFPTPGFQGAPVEIMRGCGYSCVFCSEPHVKGALVRYRDQATVMKDIEILADRGITLLYMITSELNPEGNEYILSLADKIHSFNQGQPDGRKVTWFGANYLLKFSADEYERLFKSGFTGGWFDITALDDENAQTMRTPYRNKTLISHLMTYALFEHTRQTRMKDHDENLSEGAAGDTSIHWTMFLGNPATTVETIRNTLQIANQNGLSQLFNTCGIIAPLRVFDYEEVDEATLEVTYSVKTDLEQTSYQQMLPSFAYPPALLQGFGSAEEITTTFKHIGETYLSSGYKKTRDWYGFLRKNASAESITSWLDGLSGTKGIDMPDILKSGNKDGRSATLKDLFYEIERDDEETLVYEHLAKQVVDALISGCMESFAGALEDAGLPNTIDALERMKPYDLAVAIYKRYASEQALIEPFSDGATAVKIEPGRRYFQFIVKAILYNFNLMIDPKYKDIFIEV